MSEDRLPDPLRDRAERLVASRRWTRSDLDLLRILLAADGVGRDRLLAGDPLRERSLASLLKLGLATEADGSVSMNADAKAVGDAVLAWHAAKQARASVGPAAEGRKRGEDLKRSLADAVRGVFPRIPDEVAQAAATRLAPAAVKMGGRLAAQSMVDAVVAIRMERWRQAVASEPEVAERLQAMQMRGDNNRAVKRFRDQRAVERVEAEIAEWRGGLEPVTSRRLG
ncbi:hypothetical protein [Azospirillum sp. TSO22-1]|uniref:hypothetical protein n=1 Tax=Azospirillum sp. TSO22-1 TaxID=716789 RepID=UPI000D622527|nr:hypothetical protein [Azospirillum sp. TSO22-1]PWC44882.1 hypothetical protein TSO221_16650 [Azospirillum sp. TSO22-1]